MEESAVNLNSISTNSTIRRLYLANNKCEQTRSCGCFIVRRHRVVLCLVTCGQQTKEMGHRDQYPTTKATWHLCQVMKLGILLDTAEVSCLLRMPLHSDVELIIESRGTFVIERFYTTRTRLALLCHRARPYAQTALCPCTYNFACRHARSVSPHHRHYWRCVVSSAMLYAIFVVL